MFDAERVAFGERNDCGVVALAIACGVPYEKALFALAASGRKKQQGTTGEQLQAAARLLGYRLRETFYDADTVRTLERKLIGSEILIVCTCDHALAVRDGEVRDYTRGRTHRLQNIFEVTQ